MEWFKSDIEISFKFNHVMTRLQNSPLSDESSSSFRIILIFYV